MFRSSHFSFLVFGHFWQQSYENTKIFRNLRLHFARKDGQDRKKGKENQATKVTKIPKTKRRKYGMNETRIGRKKTTERIPTCETGSHGRSLSLLDV